MGEHVIRLPDVGEGVAEAELVEWQVAVGDIVAEDSILAAVMTDKATVEIPSPVAGVVKKLVGEPGDVMAVGTEIIFIEVGGDLSADEIKKLEQDAAAGVDAAAESKPAAPKKDDKKQEDKKPKAEPKPASVPAVAKPAAPAQRTGRPLASPAVRQRALDGDIDLATVPGTGPAGRITHQDLDDFIASGGRLMARAGGGGGGGLAPRTGVHESKVIGLRRKIADNMARSYRSIPHFAYVEEVDVTELEDLRKHLNATKADGQPKLTMLPFLIQALVRALPEFPQANATFDEEAGVVTEYEAVHCGIATATPNGLMVPVVKHAETKDIWECAADVARLAHAARDGKASKEELTGSSITITSLGALGGITSTPIINYPEVAIIGVNKMVERPMVVDGEIKIRQLMNLSSSFDHRIVDGYDAARLIQKVRGLLEHPATIFM